MTKRSGKVDRTSLLNNNDDVDNDRYISLYQHKVVIIVALTPDIVINNITIISNRH